MGAGWRAPRGASFIFALASVQETTGSLAAGQNGRARTFREAPRDA